MDEDEDDMYGSSDNEVQPKTEAPTQAPPVKDESMDQDSDDEDESSEEEESDSDIEIVTEAKPGTKLEPPSQSQRVSSIRADGIVKPDSPAPGSRPGQSSAIRIEGTRKPTPPPQKPGSSYPAIRSSTLDLDAKPIHDASGKPITEVDMDEDFGEDDKPWRRPGSDQTDYFNYGFDEFTWASYCLKQDNLRKEAKDQKKQLEDMQNFMGMGGAPGGGAPANPATAMGGMGMPNDLPPEMQQMMQQMMQSGMDPSQMDFGQFMQMMGPGGQPGMQQGFGQPGNQQQQMGGYGYGGAQGGGGGHGGHAGHGGHGGHGGHVGGRGNRGRGRW